MSDVQQSQPAAGWYPDQSGSMRWWDGYQWGAYAPPAVVLQRAPGNGAAVTSLVLGVLGVLTFWMVFTVYFVIPGSIVGVIFGVVGISKARDIGGRGNAVALWGIVLNAVPLVVSAVALILYWINR